jgi:GNAT superfamily N-acetyltransferase
MPRFQLADFSGQDVIDAREVLGDVYRRAFRIDSEERIDRFISNSLVRHTEYADYRCVVARNAVNEIIGFVYGYRSEPGRWWHDTVAPELRKKEYGSILKDAFEFVEFAVVPEAQGHGVGSALHDQILAQVSQSAAMLSTDAGTNPAHAMYLRRGWIGLVTDFQYPGGGGKAVLMGLDLAEWRARASTTP